VHHIDNLTGTLYKNLASGEAALGPEMQRRIYQHACSYKNAELAELLALRGDLLADLDERLATWPGARIQAAWYKNPNRRPEQVRERLGRERRVTVLEAVAGIEGLEDVSYQACLRRPSMRVAMALLVNKSAGCIHREAVAYLAEVYETLGQETKERLLVLLGEEISKRGDAQNTQPPLAETFILVCRDIYALRDVMGVHEAYSAEALEHMHDICRTTIVEAVERQAMSNPANHGRNIRYYMWDRSHYGNLAAVACEVISRMCWVGGGCARSVQTTIKSLEGLAHALQGARMGPYEIDLATKVEACIESLGGGGKVVSKVAAARQAGTPEELGSIVAGVRDTDPYAGQVLAAALANPNIDARVAYKVGSRIRWRGVDARALVVARRHLYSPSAIAAIMVASWNVDDRLIEDLADVHPAQDLWYAIVETYVVEGESVPQSVLNSKYATKAVLEMLPVSLFTGDSVPGWLIEAMVEHLERELLDAEAWDGFEALVGRHRGSIGQLLRGVRATKRAWDQNPRAEP
jgi:hypothetical protein